MSCPFVAEARSYLGCLEKKALLGFGSDSDCLRHGLACRFWLLPPSSLKMLPQKFRLLAAPCLAIDNESSQRGSKLQNLSTPCKLRSWMKVSLQSRKKFYMQQLEGRGNDERIEWMGKVGVRQKSDLYSISGWVQGTFSVHIRFSSTTTILIYAGIANSF